MTFNLSNIWKKFLNDEINSNNFLNIQIKVNNEYKNYTCFPPKIEIFKAFNSTSPDSVKVVIIGQDPYHSKYQANGLCFSVYENIKHPPSLKNIFIELKNDINKEYPTSGDLSKWSNQGVLLLNSILTVRENLPRSHKGIKWEWFTKEIIKKLSIKRENLVFFLWGKDAQKNESLIDNKKHLILKSGHPSPLSANKGLWFGNKHFSLCNSYLQKNNKKPIDW